MKFDELTSKLHDYELDFEHILSGSGGNPDISALVYDSRKLPEDASGIIFACVKGGKNDGHSYADRAVSSGCAALLCEQRLPLDVPQIITEDARALMGMVSAILYGAPSEKMTMIGLTGTNGKTTTAYITRSILRASGQITGMMGTIVYDDGVSEAEADRTTPEGPDIQKMLSMMVKNGASCCVMEASSHGLHQGRLKGCLFDRAGFSNLTPEHLEYHNDMESYYSAKRLLFTDYVKQGWIGAVNADDEYGARLLKDFPLSARGFTLNADIKNNGFYRSRVSSMDISGMVLDVNCPDGSFLKINSPLIGRHNASNILESAAIADSLGINRDAIISGIINCPQVPGRLERYTTESGIAVFVDFAHSPDGMEKVLETIAPLCAGELWAAWGAGGDRTPIKRPLVGAIMAKYADNVIITSDNPRSEDPAAIAAHVEQGVLSSGCSVRHRVILDRRAAINFCLDSAKPGDVVLIAGKGPENYIDFGTHKVPFSDVGAVTDWIREHSQGAGK